MKNSVYRLGLKTYNQACDSEKKSTNSYQEKIERLEKRTQELKAEIKEMQAKLNPPKKRDVTD